MRGRCASIFYTSLITDKIEFIVYYMYNHDITALHMESDRRLPAMCFGEINGFIAKNPVPAPTHEVRNGMIYEYDSKIWYENDKIHRTERDQNGLTLPAVISDDGSMEWHYEDDAHNSDIDPETGFTLPAIIDKDSGSIWWFKHGKLHRDDVDSAGSLMPALIDDDGPSYWLNGEEVNVDGTPKLDH